MNNGRVYAIEESPPRPDAERPTGIGATDTATLEAGARRRGGLSWAESLALIGIAAAMAAVLLRSPENRPTTASGSQQAMLVAQDSPTKGITRVACEADGEERSESTPYVLRQVSWELDPATDWGESEGDAPVEPNNRKDSRPRKILPAELMRRGVTHCRQGRIEEGLKCFEQVVSFDPADARAHDYHARALYCLGRYAESVMACDRCLELAPDRLPAREYRREALKALRIPLASAIQQPGRSGPQQ